MPPKKLPLVKKIMLIGGVLILLQGLYIVIFSGDDQRVNVKDAITTQVAKDPAVSSDRKDLLKLQLALSSYKVKYKSYPKKLTELVPEYIESVPLDPKTGAQFKYTVTGDRYQLGEPKQDGKSGKAGKAEEVGKDEESQLIAYLDQKEDQNSFIYDNTGKKDPFRSFDFTSRSVEVVGDTPLEGHEYQDMKLTAVLEGIGEPRAIIEDPKGKGHMVGVGTKIGPNGGVIKQIEKDKVIIIEQQTDFTGEVNTRTIEMSIR